MRPGTEIGLVANAKQTEATKRRNLIKNETMDASVVARSYTMAFTLSSALVLSSGNARGSACCAKSEQTPRASNTSRRRKPSIPASTKPSERSETKQADVNSLAKCVPSPLHTEVFPQPHSDAPPALFLHDFLTDMTLFDAILQENSPLRSSAVCARLDLRGFGASPDPDGVYNRMDDVAALHASAGAGPAHLVGCGLGGVVALEYALARPEAVASVSLVSSGLPGHQWQRGVRAFFDLPLLDDVDSKQACSEDEMQAGRELARNWVRSSAEWRSSLEKGGAVAAKLKDMFKRYRYFHFWGDDRLDPDPCSGDPLSEQLGGVKAPVLTLVGEGEIGGASGDFGLIGSAIASSVPFPAYGKKTAHVLLGAGHFGTLEAWQQCQDEIAEFWTAVDASQAFIHGEDMPADKDETIPGKTAHF
jgi:pimeloyl-ACP methyl ester carboxylesterase